MVRLSAEGRARMERAKCERGGGGGGEGEV